MKELLGRYGQLPQWVYRMSQMLVTRFVAHSSGNFTLANAGLIDTRPQNSAAQEIYDMLARQDS